MRTALNNLTGNLVPLACVIAAGLIAYQGKDGWGWFLLIALFTAVSYTTNNPSAREESKS